MNRLTKKVGENYCSQSGDFYDLYNKLGTLEDLMEKYEIESVEKLEEIIKDYDEMAKDIVEMGLGVKVDFKDKSEV